MAIIDEDRKYLVQAVEDYLDEKITAFEFDDRLDTSRGSDDSTVSEIAFSLWFYYDDIDDHLVKSTREEWDYFNRLLLVLKSGAELVEMKAEHREDYCPFYNFKDMRYAVKQTGFKKKRYPPHLKDRTFLDPGVEERRETEQKLGCKIEDILFLIMLSFSGIGCYGWLSAWLSKHYYSILFLLEVALIVFFFGLWLFNSGVLQIGSGKSYFARFPGIN